MTTAMVHLNLHDKRINAHQSIKICLPQRDTIRKYNPSNNLIISTQKVFCTCMYITNSGAQ